MDIIRHEAFDALLLDAVARSALGPATCGVSTGADSRIHLLTENAPEQQRASDVLNYFGALAVEASAAALREGDADPTITCADDQIAADEALAYLVLRDGEASAHGRLDLQEGWATLRLKRPTPGAYTVLMYRLTGNFASASVQIRVDAA